MKAGQHWTMTIQNAGLGYNGYLSSPSGKKLPEGGAQFKLMTQNEINDQPPWAVALEKIGGEVIAVVGITILTASVGDALIFGSDIIETTAEIGDGLVEGDGNLTVISEVSSRYETDTLYTIEENISADGQEFGSFISEDGDGPFEQQLRSQAALLFTDADSDAVGKRTFKFIRSSFQYIDDPNF